MQPNIGPDEIQDKLSAFSHSVSLNDKANVRNYLSKIYIYPTPVGKERDGGMLLCNRLRGLERNMCGGMCGSLGVVGVRWGRHITV